MAMGYVPDDDEPFKRCLLKVAVVVLVHALVLAWLFQQQIRAAGETVLMSIEARVIEPPLEKPRPLPPKLKAPEPRPMQAPPPQVMAAAPTASASAASFAVAVQPPAPVREVPAPVVVAPAPVAPATAVAPVVTAARFDADYLNNPPPVYPAQSRRLREEGQVLLMVHVSAEGNAVAVRVREGSGFSRLDEAALAAVRQWRFVPARRGQEPVSASVIVPIEFRQGG